MPKYFSTQFHSEEWWKKVGIINPIGFDNVICNDELPVKKGNWTLYGNYQSEPFPPTGGYRVLFPTASDCLLWIRWVFLPHICTDDDLLLGEEVELYGEAKQIAMEIDKNISIKDSTMILGEIKSKIININYHQELEIYSIEEIK
jgi:hypothetical protein